MKALLSQDEVAAARKVLAALSKSEIQPFLDATKIIESDIFIIITRMAVQHAERTGDYSFIERSLLMTRSSRLHAKVVHWYEKTAGIKFVATASTIKIAEKGLARGPEIELRAFLCNGSSRDNAVNISRWICGPESPAKPKVKVKQKKALPRTPEYVGALDHRARLPGSFGSGKRK